MVFHAHLGAGYLKPREFDIDVGGQPPAMHRHELPEQIAYDINFEIAESAAKWTQGAKIAFFTLAEQQLQHAIGEQRAGNGKVANNRN